MPISAYDEEGRLKKHALQGTGLGSATDSETMKQAAQFEAIHEEAQARNLGQGEMQGILQSRATTFNEQQQSRLSQIAEQQDAMNTRYEATGDEKLEERFALQAAGGPRDDEFNAEAKADWVAAGGAKGEYKQSDLDKDRSFKVEAGYGGSYRNRDAEYKDLEKNFLKDNPDLYTMTKKSDIKDFRGVVGGEKYGLRSEQRRNIERRNERSLRNFRRDRWATLYDWEAEKAYNDRRTAVAAELEPQFNDLNTEIEERQALIEDKLELYNMFLGE